MSYKSQKRLELSDIAMGIGTSTPNARKQEKKLEDMLLRKLNGLDFVDRLEVVCQLQWLLESYHEVCLAELADSNPQPSDKIMDFLYNRLRGKRHQWPFATERVIQSNSQESP